MWFCFVQNKGSAILRGNGLCREQKSCWQPAGEVWIVVIEQQAGLPTHPSAMQRQNLRREHLKTLFAAMP
jgi:hypothetical protein